MKTTIKDDCTHVYVGIVVLVAWGRTELYSNRIIAAST